MNIFFDHQIFSLQGYGGISRYYSELIKGINQTEVGRAHLSLLLSNNIHLEESAIKKRLNTDSWKLPRKDKIIYKLNELYSIAQMKTQTSDIYHPTYYDPYLFSYIKSNKPVVITFMDMIHEKFAHKFPELAADRNVLQQKRDIVKRVDKIIAISQSTKKDLIEILNVDPAKIEVIHLGNSMPILERDHTECTFDIPDTNYLLYVGSRHIYKNFYVFVRSIAHLLRQYGMKLICGGGGPFDASDYKLFDKLGITGLIDQKPINDRILSNLYHNAYAFVFPTLYEGFGIPVLEAFACNCPCILSSGGSLPEVAGNAAIYFDPVDEQSIANALQRLLNDTTSTLRNQLITMGKQRLELFSWQKTVNETIDLYQSLL